MNEVKINVINNGSINAVSNIYHPPQPPSQTPTIKEIKIFTYSVTLTAFSETYATILTLIIVHPMMASLLLQRQKTPKSILPTLLQLKTIT